MTTLISAAPSSMKSLLTRRKFLATTVGAGAALTLSPSFLAFAQSANIIHRPIPKTGQLIPAIGLGSSATFAAVARSEDVSAISDVLSRMHGLGGRIFDTAPSYGASEEVAGQIAQDLGIQEELFWATPPPHRQPVVRPIWKTISVACWAGCPTRLCGGA